MQRSLQASGSVKRMTIKHARWEKWKWMVVCRFSDVLYGILADMRVHCAGWQGWISDRMRNKQCPLRYIGRLSAQAGVLSYPLGVRQSRHRLHC